MLWLVLFGSTCLIWPVRGGLRIQQKCGEMICGKHEYCSRFDHHCRNCSDICDPDSHNFEESTCEDECQYYIHDVRYHTRNSDEASSAFVLALTSESPTTLSSVNSQQVTGHLETRVNLLFAFVVVSFIIHAVTLGFIGWPCFRRRVLHWKTKTKVVEEKEKVYDVPNRPGAEFRQVQRSSWVISNMGTLSRQPPPFYGTTSFCSPTHGATNCSAQPQPLSVLGFMRHPSEEACPEGCYENPALCMGAENTTSTQETFLDSTQDPSPTTSETPLSSKASSLPNPLRPTSTGLSRQPPLEPSRRGSLIHLTCSRRRSKRVRGTTESLLYCPGAERIPQQIPKKAFTSLTSLNFISKKTSFWRTTAIKCVFGKLRQMRSPTPSLPMGSKNLMPLRWRKTIPTGCQTPPSARVFSELIIMLRRVAGRESAGQLQISQGQSF
ncbi:unnamed protein product [Cyprideis torosa]|uniref:Uncharacterized protein n=1 Tax=Cyprideis torosa TaxID=163714 RepID=A0A7R8WCS8_9CRUS|nr:unnamed protein product [Cyprideis torosa]CAG0891223.1 unnamed protein product [Cyprideis torosa]